MKRKLIISALTLFLLAGCQGDSTSEILENKSSNGMKVVEIIDTKKWENKKLVIFVSEEANAQWIRVTLLEKKRILWHLIHSDGLSLTDQPLKASNENFYIYDEDEEIETIEDAEQNRVSYTYGVLRDKAIESVEVEREGEFREVQIYETEYGRFFFSINKWSPVRALDDKGEVIYEEDFLG